MSRDFKLIPPHHLVDYLLAFYRDRSIDFDDHNTLQLKKIKRMATLPQDEVDSFLKLKFGRGLAYAQTLPVAIADPKRDDYEDYEHADSLETLVLWLKEYYRQVYADNVGMIPVVAAEMVDKQGALDFMLKRKNGRRSGLAYARYVFDKATYFHRASSVETLEKWLRNLYGEMKSPRIADAKEEARRYFQHQQNLDYILKDEFGQGLLYASQLATPLPTPATRSKKSKYGRTFTSRGPTKISKYGRAYTSRDPTRVATRSNDRICFK